MPLREIYEGLHYAANLRFDLVGRDLDRLTVPAMVAWADDDKIVESEIGAEVARRAPAGPRLHFETGGHNLQKSMAVEIGELLVDWVPGLLCDR